eukprot:TRINITY_DN2320_c0_g1_i1.p1 TRINITY_DN2320_c0_g1~~TRINITY_DN2320_c0_g1_i1.p1  ORF type:complete len:920 (+),score=173.05 TRINITY_DN2320_c0_g1_i1:468-3227(+)
MSHLSPRATLGFRTPRGSPGAPSPSARRSKTAGSNLRPRPPESPASNASPMSRRSTIYKNNDTYEPGNDTVKVYVRVRPLNKKEQRLGPRKCLEVDKDTNTVGLRFSNEVRRYPFEAVADEDTTQDQVFESVGKPMVEHALNGYNGAIMVYGQTGAGKTYTMHGSSPGDEVDENPGLVPKFLQELFEKIGERQSDTVEFTVKCQYLEIYNEHIFDLLDPDASPQSVANPNRRTRAKTRARQNDMIAGRGRGHTDALKLRYRKGQVEADQVSQKTLNGPNEAQQFLAFGNENRSVGMTRMNRESSRSHSIFTILIECRDSGEGGEGIKNVRKSTVHLVDLAGSERQDKTHLAGTDMMKESSSINKSLSALGNVIMALADVAHGKSRHIPYRDSKLTFFLRESLGGNAKTMIIANVSPSGYNFGETLSTLQFVQRAKHIRTTAIVNENILGSIQLLQKEVKRLKEELAIAKAEGGEGAAEGVVTVGVTQHPVYQALVRNGTTLALDRDPPEDADEQELLSHRVFQLEELLLRVFDEHGDLEKENDKLSTKLLSKDDLVKRKERTMQSAKMVMKLREAEIARLKGLLNDPERTGDTDTLVEQLRQEIHELQTQMQHNPDVMRLAIENLDLRYQLQEYQQEEGRVNEKVILQLKAAVKTSHRLSLQVKQLIKEKHTLKTALTDSEAAPSASRRLATCTNCGDAVEPSNDEAAAEIAALKSRLRAAEAANQQLREQLIDEQRGHASPATKGKLPARKAGEEPKTLHTKRTGKRPSREAARSDQLPPVTSNHASQAPLKLKQPGAQTSGGATDGSRPGHRRNQSSFTEAPRGGVTPPPPQDEPAPKTPPTHGRGIDNDEDTPLSPQDIRVPKSREVRIPSDNEVVGEDGKNGGPTSSRSLKSVTFATTEGEDEDDDESSFEEYIR